MSQDESSGGPIYGAPPVPEEEKYVDNGAAARVHKIMMGDPEDPEHFPGALYKKGEVDESTGKPPNDAVIVQGIVSTYGFHPERLKTSRPEVIKIINEVVSDQYFKGSGGGYTALALLEDRNGTVWADEHRTVEVLICLGIGLGLAGYCLTRDFWPSLPGGMPYVWFSKVPA